MKTPASRLDPSQIKAFPLAQRHSLCRIENVLANPDASPPPCPVAALGIISQCADKIARARRNNASVIIMYGAHLLRNGAALIMERMMAQNWITHLATNGAGTIHDWEFAYHGQSTENVKENVAKGIFGAWDETGRNIHLALLAGGLDGAGYGESLGKFIMEDGAVLPQVEQLEQSIKSEPAHPLSSARADALRAMLAHKLDAGRHKVEHRWKHASILGQAFRHGISLTVHPGIGYDIITVHPMFNGAVIGRAAALDFGSLAGAIDGLDAGVVLSIGSAVMAPQVFEKALSCANNVRRQQGRPVVSDHSIYVVDIQPGGDWDWSQSEPPKTNPAYYLRFCKSFSRMGGTMEYVCCDNISFLHNLYHQLRRL